MLHWSKALFLAPVLVVSAALAGMPQGGVANENSSLAEPTIPADVIALGEALYKKNCRLCHGTKGTSGKRLSGNERLADADYVASVILTGPGYMTPFEEHLSDEEIALIVTYVRNAWGQAYGPIAADDVAQLR